MDGGAHSPTNLDLVAGLGLDVVVVSAPMSHAGPPPRDRRGWSSYRLSRRYLHREADRVRQGGTRVVLLEPGREERAVMGWQVMAVERVGAVAAAAYAAARRMLDTARVREDLDLIEAG